MNGIAGYVAAIETPFPFVKRRPDMRLLCACVCAVILAFLAPGLSSADAPVIDIATPMPAPDWALLERAVLDANAEAIEVYFKTYFDNRGYYLHTMRWGTLDGADDAAENFRYWNQLYALGGSERVLELFHKGYEGHLLQYKDYRTTVTQIAKDGAYYREFLPQSDAFHTREGIQTLLQQGLSDPMDVRYQQRMRRFAGLYMNEDPDAPNYDAEKNIIRSLWTGSKGPMLHDAISEDWVGDPFTGKYNILHGAGGFDRMEDAAEAYPKMLLHEASDLHSEGDYPGNLFLTCIQLHAYMLGHDQKYKDWLLKYANGWKERTITNGGNIPANVGLDGTTGGEFGGRWYKGKYGWNESRWSADSNSIVHINTIHRSMWIGFGNAFLLTGDTSWLDVMRRQLENFYAQGKTIDGQFLIPFNYGEFEGKTGWYNYVRPSFNSFFLQLWLWSLEDRDLKRLSRTGWLGFLLGENPDWPAAALRGDLKYIHDMVDGIRHDPTTPDTRLADWAMFYNPARAITLTNCMLGGDLNGKVFNLHSQLRYFDPAKQRPGVPADVAALVTAIDKQGVTVTLVNVNQVEPRELIVQAGGYGEHQVKRVTVNGGSLDMDGPWFTVRLAPGAGAELRIERNRYVNEPTLAFPWQGDTVPVP